MCYQGSINAAFGIMTEDDWRLHVYGDWLDKLIYNSCHHVFDVGKIATYLS